MKTVVNRLFVLSRPSPGWFKFTVDLFNSISKLDKGGRKTFSILFFILLLCPCLTVTSSQDSWDNDNDQGNSDNIQIYSESDHTDLSQNSEINNNVNVNSGEISRDNKNNELESANEISQDEKTVQRQTQTELDSEKKLDDILTYVSDMAEATNLAPMLHKEIESTLLRKHKNKLKNNNNQPNKKPQEEEVNQLKKNVQKANNNNNNNVQSQTKSENNKQAINQNQSETSVVDSQEVEQESVESVENLEEEEDEELSEKPPTKYNSKSKKGNKNKNKQSKSNKSKSKSKPNKQVGKKVNKKSGNDGGSESDSESAASNPKNPDKTSRIWKRLKIPNGSILSLSFQLTRPNVLPGFWHQPEGIVMDAVVELPIALDLAAFAQHVYSKPKPENPLKPLLNPTKPPATEHKPKPEGGEEAEEDGAPSFERSRGRSSRSKSDFIGYERCFLYNQLEIFAARSMEVTQAVAHSCILRTICELHSLLTFKPHFSNASLLFELIRVFFTPSLGLNDECFRPYLKAERTGRKKTLCYSYVRDCPVSFASVILSNFVPNFVTAAG